MDTSHDEKRCSGTFKLDAGSINLYYWGKGPGKTDKNPELLFTKEAKPTKSLHMGIALKENDRVIGDLPCDYRSIENFYMKLAKLELESGLGAGKIEEIFRHEAQASS